MTFKVIQGHGQGEEMTSVPYRDYFCQIIAHSVAMVCAKMMRLTLVGPTMLELGLGLVL